jgi:hypothetical protein
MSRGVEHHPNMFLWLEFSERGSNFDGPRNPYLQILDSDVEVGHHLLLAGR